MLVGFFLKSINLSILSLQEPNNLKAKNSFRYNGLVNKKTVGVEPCKDGKGVVLVSKNARGEFSFFPDCKNPKHSETRKNLL